MIKSVLVIATGSNGNCYKITADDNSELMIEFGIKYENLIKNFSLNNVSAALYSHTDKDHFKEYDAIKLAGIDVYGPNHLLTAGQLANIKGWQVLPIRVPHRDTICYSYIIKHGNSHLLFCTDLEKMPNIADNYNFDFMLVEANYLESIVEEKIKNNEKYNISCHTHLSLEKLIEWLKPRKFKPKNLVIVHTSNSHLFDGEIAKNKLKEFGKNIFIAYPYLEICNKEDDDD